MISAHWEEALPTVSANPHPGMLFDYDGFPEQTYDLSYPAPGSPELAARVDGLLKTAGLATAVETVRGFDHGVFVPMLIIDPKAQIPVVSLSLQQGLDPAFHLALGAALAPLREEGILIIGSGSSYHNLRGFFSGQGAPASAAFDQWLRATVTEPDAAKRIARLTAWEQAPHARECHPRAEHLLPLMVAAGAAKADDGVVSFHDSIGGKAMSCFTFG
jgi:aromatic ring-opening dioxygenase catalytic subunit (LigB family)